MLMAIRNHILGDVYSEGIMFGGDYIRVAYIRDFTGFSLANVHGHKIKKKLSRL